MVTLLSIPFLTVAMGIFILCFHMWKCLTLCLPFTGAHGKDLDLHLRGDIDLELFSNVKTLKALATLRDGQNVFCVKKCA